MTPAGWVTFAASLVTLVSTLTCGWLGGSAFRAGKRWIGAAILATPLVFTIGLPALAQALPLGDHPSLLREHLEITSYVLMPIVTVIALLMSKRYLPEE
jgi:hypothetical protein